DPDRQANGISLTDFAVLAGNWAKQGPKIVISEFLAINTAKHPLAANEIVDEDNDSSDWLELCNVSDETIDLEGWYLTSDAADLKEWEIPAITLAPEEFCIIFASGKNRKVPGENLHTNFSISSDPGFLALVKPDGKTIVHKYEYPTQFGDISYGMASPYVRPTEEVTLVTPGAAANAYIPTSDALGLSWVQTDFTPAGWLSGTTGVAYEHSPGAQDYSTLMGLNVGAMHNKNCSVYIRIPFTINDLSGLHSLALSMKYDDGFAAYINGMPVAASDTAPATLTWNSKAIANQPDPDAVVYEDFVLSQDVTEYLQVGENILAIHGLNDKLSSSDFLCLPQLTAMQDHTVSLVSNIDSYFQNASPGIKNGTGQMELGPQVLEVTENPEAISEDENLTITAKVTATDMPVSAVVMNYLTGFNPETTVTMSDDGQGADQTAGDGIYSAVIPASAYSAGDMVRWSVEATDSNGATTRVPQYLLPDNSPRYFGTIINDPTIETNINVFQYFVQDVYASNTDTGTRCSVYYLGEFYDNVFIRHRGGNTTSGNKIQFNDGYHFSFDPAYERVDEINLNTNGNDPTYLRPLLSFPIYEEAGVACSKVFPLHVIQNNSYLGVRIFIEQPDRHLLRRTGLDDRGAFYKVYSDLSYDDDPETEGLQDYKRDEQPLRKISRLYEDNSDIAALREGICPGNPNRNIFLFDNVNVPAVISYLAACTLVHENDHTHKNYFLYRDTENTGEWMFIPWDKDLTYGINHGIAGIIADQDWPDDLNRSPSHPFYGSKRHQKTDLQWNRLFDAIYADPTAREMYVRRLRSLMDTHLQAPGTPTAELLQEKQVDDLVTLLTPELYTPVYQASVNLLKNSYLPVRRTHLYVNHLHGTTWPDDPANIPDAQPEVFSLQIGAIDYNPTSWNQDEEYIEILNPNSFAADISGWTVTGAVDHTFAGGTVIPANGKMHITPNALAFRSRTSSPKGGEHLFVQGNYSGHLSSWGETITIKDLQGNIAATQSYTGSPSNTQQYLRITEMMYHPLDSTDPAYENSDYEYLELVNTGTSTLSLVNVAFTKGISYTFPAGTQLAGGEYILLVKNASAFAARYSVANGVQIFSGYEGNLSNSGEIIKLEDHTHSSILDFEYDDKWYDITDGEGFSLTFAGALTGEPVYYSSKTAWRASTFSGGSPGQNEQGLTAGSIVINEVLAHSHAGQPDWIELYNATSQNINIGGWYLSDKNDSLADIMRYQIPDNTIIAAGGYMLFSQDSSFGSSSQPEEKRFGLSEAGETVYLYSGQNGEVTGYYQTQQKFDASETGVSFGRYEKASLSSGYDFVRMATTTPLAANSGPMIPALVITEIMYDPAQGTDSEYIELYNRSGNAITLMTEVTTEATAGEVITEQLPWRINGIGFEFNAGVVIAPYEYIIVARVPATFAASYAGLIPAGTRVFGPYSGKLSNEGEDVQLQIPGDQEYGEERYYIPLEKVEYSIDNPWPAKASGTGKSLTRTGKAIYADDPANWHDSEPTPGM
ncbi:MAG: lamin tail domain-containing protein, partial [Sedimentisphaerales bacterium]|nr:lamin tail domain-containing protein [Sedimentisphaerales bacterium]